ncbi:MAG TPA: hypothetical protein PKU94_06285 [Candidatus Hydrothermia bacterium]|nr:hypothetical protein [Methanobacterium virus PhiF1]HOP32967.1 hypothetical protein [Candidatus Hydrothermia bacterium]
MAKEEVKESETLTEEEYEDIDAAAAEAAEKYDNLKKVEEKSVLATKELLMERGKKPFKLYVWLDEDTPVYFKVKRMKEKHRQKLQKVEKLRYGDPESLTEEDIELLTQYSYEILAELIVEPKMDVDEWKEIVDLPLLTHLMSKITLLSFEVNDAVIVEEFRKK